MISAGTTVVVCLDYQIQQWRGHILDLISGGGLMHLSGTNGMAKKIDLEYNLYDVRDEGSFFVFSIDLHRPISFRRVIFSKCII